MRDLLFFDSMIAPKVITFIYWLMLAGCVIYGLVLLFGSFGVMKYSVLTGFGMLVLSPVAVIVGAVFARIYCEVLIVIFKINEALQEIRQK